jgi:RNA polymerase sigma-70 factor (ECF subfamily)
MQELCAGQQDALAQLYDRYAPLMLALARRVLGDEREAHDLLHDVFLEVWEHAREYQSERGSVRTWLLIRTRSRALDRKRSARMSKRTDLEHDERSDDSHLSLAPERMSVRAALEALPDETRHSLELSYFAGMTGPEIATHLNIPEGTVRSRLARGLLLLEELLNAKGSVEHE